MKPSSFLYGAATSAHQVEGNNIHNDWWAWEQKTPSVTKSGLAADHFRRWREDLALAQQLGHTAHRFSIEWSRIEPVPGQFNRPALEHYREVLTYLKKNNIQSFVTLHHFTNPLWFAESGGWLRADAAEQFNRYVAYVVQYLGDLTDFWITLNEPNVYAYQSYLLGLWPPQEKNLVKTLRVGRHMAAAHKQAFRTIHTYFPDAKVGIAQSVVARPVEPKRHRWESLKANFFDYWHNHRFIRQTKGSHDFIGLNYYFSQGKLGMTSPEGATVSDMGWNIMPQGLTQLLLDFKRYGKPLYITENGLADAADKQRADFIRSHIKAIEAAQSQGADVRGYLHWALIDNYEWADGFTPRFGLVEVDYATQERRVRPSAYVYKAIIEQASRSK